MALLLLGLGLVAQVSADMNGMDMSMDGPMYDHRYDSNFYLIANTGEGR